MARGSKARIIAIAKEDEGLDPETGMVFEETQIFSLDGKMVTLAPNRVYFVGSKDLNGSIVEPWVFEAYKRMKE